MKRPARYIYILIICVASVVLLDSCKVLYPSRMLKTGKEYPYTPLPDSFSESLYRIAPNDELSILVSTNDGERVLDPTSTGNAGGMGQNANQYLVEHDGTINLPLLRRVEVEGLSLREAEGLLEERLSFYFNHPFVKMKVTNNRVIIFPGGMGGNAQVIRLENPNTTLFEALALAGGISDGKAYRIKLIRGEPNARKVYLIDLSAIEGMKQADLVLMANDVIYVEPVYRVPQTLLAQIAPYLSLVSTMLVIYAIFK